MVGYFCPQSSAEQQSIHQINYTEESSQPKYTNLSQLLQKQARKNSGFSFCHITQRDYYNTSYLPTRSPPSLQLQIQNFQFNSLKAKKSQVKKMMQYEQKCKTLPVNEFGQDEISKRIQEKQKMLEDMYLPKERSITSPCAIYIPQQLKKNQEAQTLRPPQSRVSSAYQKNRKVNIIKPTALTLGLNIERCKLIGRLKTQSPFYPRKGVGKNNFRNTIIAERCQTLIPKPINGCLNKKISIPVSKWDYSDGENQ